MVLHSFHNAILVNRMIGFIDLALNITSNQKKPYPRQEPQTMKSWQENKYIQPDQISKQEDQQSPSWHL